ncbi:MULTISPECIES: L,D-transpeptidase [Alphaproteobacteria]|uniref:L,D-transpeptidase n=2 Tax=Alphaproteobacteria TaxID=28211 RepID=A0A512HFM0_9HYPH|nr:MULTISPECIES: L,D-transpeptidase [Alphaproteobacteria]GEO84247.1 L,D-transpeptidase [Ciceribacter naphthalenivorans]GLR24783.1 L,D-transpeptidase [Ciceribacter naphthalenivorans]GLT07639.1 L,D-transpeptidase [Sphingomonas psychrolutea]
MPSSNHLSRRAFLSLSGLGAASLLAGCASSRPVGPGAVPVANPRVVDRPLTRGSAELDAMYGEIYDGGYVIPAVPYTRIDPRYYRQRVVDPTGQPPGTIVVDTPSRFLYLVEPGGTAMRYGVGIGREGFAWQGTGVIQWRQKWPKWTPPDEMIGRKPELAKYSADNGGMSPGLDNPLGARALYIFQNGQDTLYRLHGSPEWNSIGKAVSSGCVRLLNQDIIDLYQRVPNKARVLVWQ